MCALACFGYSLFGSINFKPISRFGGDLQKSRLYIVYFNTFGMANMAYVVNCSSAYFYCESTLCCHLNHSTMEVKS
jgi:hypothetical protein